MRSLRASTEEEEEEEEEKKNEALAVDSVMRIASCTKLLTCIAAMQCVERGLITLDEDVRPVLHELGDLDIIVVGGEREGEGEGEGDGVSTCKNTAPITLRYGLEI